MAEDVVREIIRFREDHDMPETLPNDADVLQTMLDGEVDHEFDVVGTVFGIIKEHGGDPDILEALFKRYPPDSVVAVIKEYFPHVLGDPKN